MIADGRVNKKAVDWLVIATDPFHDDPVDAAGFPDINTVPTITQQFTFTTVVSSPTPASTAPWNCHVFFAPVSPMMFQGTPSRLNRTGVVPGLMQLQDTTFGNSTIGSGYNIHSFASSTWPDETAVENHAAEMPNNILGGCYRLVAAGVEVVNTTSTLYKQGAVTYYRAPSHSVTAQFNSLANSWLIPFDTFSLPPSSQAAAQLYPTSRTMAAEEGYYGIATLGQDPEFLNAFGTNVMGTWAPASASLTNSAVQSCYIPISEAGAPIGSGSPRTTSAQVLPFDTHGAWFSGLSQQTTLQVTTRYYVERIPSADDADLLVLTRPPTPYDPTIQEIYSRVLSQLPVGCTVDENPLGEWFNDVLQAVIEYAPGVGDAFGPMGSAAGKLVAGGARKLLKSRQPAPKTTAPTGNVLQSTTQKPKPKQRRTRRQRGRPNNLKKKQ